MIISYEGHHPIKVSDGKVTFIKVANSAVYRDFILSFQGKSDKVKFFDEHYNQLEKNNLTNFITNSQKQQIINLLITIKKSGALNSNSFKEQAQKLSSQIQEGAKSIFNKLNSQDTKNWIQKVIDAVVNFFKGLFGGAIILN